MYITLYLLVSPADKFCKQFVPRTGLTKLGLDMDVLFGLYLFIILYIFVVVVVRFCLFIFTYLIYIKISIRHKSTQYCPACKESMTFQTESLIQVSSLLRHIFANM